MLVFRKVKNFISNSFEFGSSFVHNLSFITPFELIIFANEALDQNFLIRPNSHSFGTIRNCFMLQELFAWF